MSLFASGPSAQYQGNPALQQMLLAAAMRGQGGAPTGMIPPLTPLGPPQTVTSERVPVVPTDSPLQGAPLPDASNFTGPQANRPTPPQNGPTLPPVNAQQFGNAAALIGNGRATPPGMQPVSADGSKPLADFSQNLNGIAMPTIAQHNGIDWHRIAGIVGDALLGASGQPGIYGPAMRERQKIEAAQQFEMSKLAFEQHSPRAIGHSMVQQGADGQYQTLYSEPEPFESYAAAQGLNPGTPEYADAVKNYRLGAWSDDAVAAKTGLAGYRYDRMGTLQDDRLATTRRNTDVRVGASNTNNIRTTGATMRGQNMHSATTQRGQTMTDNRVRGSASYRGTGGRVGGGAPVVAVGPNGHQIVVKNGRWVDAQTGQPVQ